MGLYGHFIPRRVLLTVSQILMLAGSAVLALPSSVNHYSTHVLPAIIIDMIGSSGALVGATVTIVANAPAGEEGIVCAVLHTTLRVGATLGIAVATAISLGVDATLPFDPTSQLKGHVAAFWSSVGMHGIMIIMIVLFIHK